jgi:MFS family permease
MRRVCSDRRVKRTELVPQSRSNPTEKAFASNLLAEVTRPAVHWRHRRGRTLAGYMSRFPAFESRNFRIFWLGQFLSLIGTWMQNTTLPYLAYRITGQPIYLGYIGFAATLPALLFTLPAGVLVERLNKRTVVIAMQALLAAQAFALAALALSGWIQIWHIVALAFMLGCANAFEITARQVMMPELVSKVQLPNALALNALAFNLARVIGPVLAAPLLALIASGGEGWAFFANGVSYLVVIIGLLAMRIDRATNAAGRVASTGMQAFLSGAAYIRRSPIVTIILMTALVTGFFGFTASQQLPVFARDVLAQPEDSADAAAARNSALVAAMGVGALIASALLTWFSTLKRKGLVLTLGHFVFGLAILLVGLSRDFTVSVLGMAFAGLGLILANNLSNQVIQLEVPAELRARVFSTYVWALQGVTPFGSLLVGAVAQQFGAPWAVLMCALACLASPIFVNLATDRLRRYVAG